MDFYSFHFITSCRAGFRDCESLTVATNLTRSHVALRALCASILQLDKPIIESKVMHTFAFFQNYFSFPSELKKVLTLLLDGVHLCSSYLLSTTQAPPCCSPCGITVVTSDSLTRGKRCTNVRTQYSSFLAGSHCRATNRTNPCGMAQPRILCMIITSHLSCSPWWKERVDLLVFWWAHNPKIACRWPVVVTPCQLYHHHWFYLTTRNPPLLHKSYPRKDISCWQYIPSCNGCCSR